MTKIAKTDIFDLLRALLIALLFSVAGVIVLAVIAKFADLSEGVVGGVNIAVRMLALLTGVLLGVKGGRAAIKGVLTGLLFALCTYFISVIVAGGFSASSMTVFDALACALAGLISGGIKAMAQRDAAP